MCDDVDRGWGSPERDREREGSGLCFLYNCDTTGGGMGEGGGECYIIMQVWLPW